jgi:hypothetical protein
LRTAPALIAASTALLLSASALARVSAAPTAAKFACSRPDSAKVPCRFQTPSGNIRCLWTPSPNSVVCELLATGRAYRLRPTGKAKRIGLNIRHKGETLPTNQQLVFPQSLSCHDSRTTMTCNQDFGFGFFKLSPKGSRSA